MQRFSLVILCLSLGISTGCVRLPSAPTVPTNDPKFKTVQNPTPAGMSADAAEPLSVYPGDTLAVTTISAEQVTYPNILVDETGSVHMPLVGDVKVGGLSLTKAEAQMQEALRRFDRVVRVNIAISEFGGHQVTVLGAVANPGRLPIVPGMRLADLLGATGGAAAPAGEISIGPDYYAARLVRKGKVLPVSLALAMEGNPRHNIRVRPGDYLYIPPAISSSISVLGEVDNPRVIPFYAGIRLTEALAISGGINIEGDRADIRIVRGGLKNPQVYRTSLVKLVEGKQDNIALAQGDIVYVTEHWTASVGQFLNRIGPLLTTATNGTLSGLLLYQTIQNAPAATTATP